MVARIFVAQHGRANKFNHRVGWHVLSIGPLRHFLHAGQPLQHWPVQQLLQNLPRRFHFGRQMIGRINGLQHGRAIRARFTGLLDFFDARAAHSVQNNIVPAIFQPLMLHDLSNTHRWPQLGRGSERVHKLRAHNRHGDRTRCQ